MSTRLLAGFPAWRHENAGTIRFTSAGFEGCDGFAWVTLAGTTPRLAGLALWVTAEGSGVDLVGSNVSRWIDQSGNGNHMVAMSRYALGHYLLLGRFFIHALYSRDFTKSAYVGTSFRSPSSTPAWVSTPTSSSTVSL